MISKRSIEIYLNHLFYNQDCSCPWVLTFEKQPIIVDAFFTLAATLVIQQNEVSFIPSEST
ncbi:CLUMA_CG001646, isoform A [Clunio marinus]|uniref:CLUMA_CG001646, isoform A n=1 Tax=Clunio marinus TaxID=568069 RepID=A0A1J1HIW6_9DIPT|nr:CLUMA_CG001646, isoform A [Clunio marinus]